MLSCSQVGQEAVTFSVSLLDHQSVELHPHGVEEDLTYFLRNPNLNLMLVERKP